MKDYNYIILGAGASGLMLAYRMANDSFFDDKSILIIDKDSNKGNDRTWSYWEEGQGKWDDVTDKIWDSVFFSNQTFSKTIDILPYRYKMIRSEAFYNKMWDRIKTKSNIQFLEASVDDFKENDTVVVKTSRGEFSTSQLFNSIPKSSYKNQEKFPVLQQHFLGWFIKTAADTFDDATATFMDFSVPQKGNTRFMYVLPVDKQTALFEYTLFSKDLLEISEYENAIKSYLNEKGIKDYEIIETEKGSIPMTSYNFLESNTSKIFNIGTAGGWTKASTGYTFRATTKKTKDIIELLKKQKDISNYKGKRKFWFYDLLFLDVLANHNESGSALFSSLFKKTDVKTIFRFLDEESSLLEDLKIIISVPPKHFISALFKRLF
ncbi:lycopene cyclase [Winogradskyella sp. PC-19]|uniref:lycopene cyclase family protein n=1 Tax=unclassified Winogradskyella TaxID=2615021 RepID=UPI000B3CC32A|nr:MULTISPECIES: lycopene cyclase family protein [unclassified Winogradskyella]ARV10628.1 lycopene cyclase [Winogradskyella sp. PC-19]RZN81003.1 MAG: lycopene cyclase [Winogradskyella sp.]